MDENFVKAVTFMIIFSVIQDILVSSNISFCIINWITVSIVILIIAFK